MEIERKWLAARKDIPYALEELEACTIEQAYISFSPVIRIRRKNGGEAHVMTVKTRPEGPACSALACEEHEFPISASEYESLLEKAAGRVIHKTRYLHPLPNGLTEEIDVFSGELEGLVFVEIEFPDVETAESWPDSAWISRDVSRDDRYKNSSLAAGETPPMAE